jgi:MFS family permease
MNDPVSRIKKLYNEYPRLFWILVMMRFIDALGGTILFPFFSLYITQRFHVGMAQAGVLLGISSLFGMLGSMAGGALADKFGRKRLIIFGMIFSAISGLSYAFANNIVLLYPLTIVVGLLSSVANPAYEATLVDILPEEKRQEGYGILRVVFNYAWIFGTAMGGFIAARSFFMLFVIDATMSCTVALLTYRLIPETKPRVHAEMEHKEETLWETVKGYRIVIKDMAFVGFILAGMMALIAYQQQYSTLAVYLRDIHGIDSKGYGLILSITGLEVVFFQFWISRTIRYRPAFLMMMLGTGIFAVGIFMYGFVNGFFMFVIAAIIVCIGEMFYFPTSQVLAAGFAPKDMRGRYMAVAGLVWSIPSTLGPGAAGYILDNFNPHLLWYIAGSLCVISAISYFSLHVKLGEQKRFIRAKPEAEIFST